MLNGEDGYQAGKHSVPIVGARGPVSQYLADRELPNHREAEQGALAAVLLDEEDSLTDKIMVILRPEDFHLEDHETIFTAMKRMHEAGMPIDANTLADELGPVSFRQVGGADYLAEIIGKIPHHANGVYYAEIVKQKSTARALIKAASEIIAEGYSQQFTSDEQVQHAVKRLEEIEQSAARDGDDFLLSDKPLRMEEPAFRGLANDVVQCILPETEACRETILLQFLTAIGNLFGPTPHFKVGATRHRCNLFTCIVGPTGFAKGMSWDATEWALGESNPDWTAKPFLSGMTSGEGVIVVADEMRGPVLAVETEFARTLINMNRDGNSLNAILRQGWESERMRIPTKNNPIYVEGAHLSVIAHVPPTELKGKLSPADIDNGMVNRFLWAGAYLSKLLPRGGSIENMEAALGPFKGLICEAVVTANALKHTFRRTQKAEALWEHVYGSLRLRPPGPHGSATARAAPLTMRLALIYALLDRKRSIDVSHLESALAVWDYCDATAKTIFGESAHDVKMDKLLAALEAAPEGMTRTQIARHVFRSHISKGDLTALLDMAKTNGNLVYIDQNSDCTKPPSWMHQKYASSAHSAHLRTAPHND